MMAGPSSACQGELPYGRPLALVRWKGSLANLVENETRTGILALEVRQPSGNAGEECTDAAPHDQRERLLERKCARPTRSFARPFALARRLRSRALRSGRTNAST